MLSDRLPACITLWMVYLCQLPQYLQGHTQTPFLSWYYLNSWLWTSGTTFTPTGPWHSLSILLAHPLSFCSLSKHPACSPSPSPHSPQRDQKRPSISCSLQHPHSFPPVLPLRTTPQGGHLPSILWQLCLLLSCIFKVSFFRQPFPSAYRYSAVTTPIFKEEMSPSPYPALFPFPLLAALVTKHLRRTADTAASFPFFPFFSWTRSSHAFDPLCSDTQLCLTVWDPVDCSPPSSLSMQFSRQECWSGLPFSSLGVFPSDPSLFWDSSRQGH